MRRKLYKSKYNGDQAQESNNRRAIGNIQRIGYINTDEGSQDSNNPAPDKPCLPVLCEQSGGCCWSDQQRKYQENTPHGNSFNNDDSKSRIKNQLEQPCLHRRIRKPIVGTGYTNKGFLKEKMNDGNDSK